MQEVILQWIKVISDIRDVSCRTSVVVISDTSWRLGTKSDVFQDQSMRTLQYGDFDLGTR